MTKQKAQKAQAVILRAKPEGSMHRSFAEFTPFLVSLVEKKTTHAGKRTGLAGVVTALLAPLIQGKTSHADKKNKSSNQKKPSYLRHLNFLLHADLIDHNSKGEEGQRENSAQQKVLEDKGFSGDHSNDQNRKGNLAAVIEEFGDIVSRTRIHGAETLSKDRGYLFSILKLVVRFLSDLVRKGWFEAVKGLRDSFKTLKRHDRGVVKMKIHKNIDKKSLHDRQAAGQNPRDFSFMGNGAMVQT